MKIIYGTKGSGKTKAIIDNANQTVETAKGHVIYITDSTKNMYEIKRPIRFIDTTAFNVQGSDGLRGFLKGIVAANGDNEFIFLDGIARITDRPLAELENIFGAIEKLEKDFGVTFTLTCSADKADLPPFIAKFVD